MWGIAVGDAIGSRFDFRPPPEPDFELWGEGARFSDESVCASAVALWALAGAQAGARARFLRSICLRWPDAGYGGMFSSWLRDERTGPYGSKGNGCIPRSAPCAWLFADRRDALEAARLSAEVTHNDESSFAAVAAYVDVLRALLLGSGKKEALGLLRAEHPRLLPDLVAWGGEMGGGADGEARGGRSQRHPPRLKEGEALLAEPTLKAAFGAFFSTPDVEGAIRAAVLAGPDCDTTAAVACSLAEACAGSVGAGNRRRAESLLPPFLADAFGRVAAGRLSL